MRLPKRAAPLLVAAIVAGVMTFVVSGISTWRGQDGSASLLGAWMTSWGVSWVVAFPMLVLLRPAVVRFVGRIVG